MLRALLLLSVWSGLAVPVGFVFLPWATLTRNGSLLYRWGTRAAAAGLRLAGVRLRARYEQPLDPKTAYLFLSNHASNLDPPILAAVLAPRRAAMLIKQELLRLPLLGRGMLLAGFVPVARSGSVEDAKRSLEQSAAVLASGISLVVFPEGTRSTDGKLLPFKKGTFFLARECGVPVVPVTILGTHALMPKSSLKLSRGTVEIVFHKPLLPRDYPSRDALKEAVRAAIASALPTDEGSSSI